MQESSGGSGVGCLLGECIRQVAWIGRLHSTLRPRACAGQLLKHALHASSGQLILERPFDRSTRSRAQPHALEPAGGHTGHREHRRIR